MKNQNTKQQQHYYSGHRKSPRLEPGLTPVVQQHFRHSTRGLQLAGTRVLELGAGLGRFTGLLAAQGCQVTALELSGHFARQLESRYGSQPGVEVVQGSALDLGDRFGREFDVVTGFFFLHHIVNFERLFGEISLCLKPGGALRFSEPNAYNPLYYIQVALTPGMSFSGEPSLRQMRLPALQGPLEKAGFTSIESETYGLFPPFVANQKLGGQAENVLDSVLPFPSIRAYRLITATAGSPTTDHAPSG